MALLRAVALLLITGCGAGPVRLSELEKTLFTPTCAFVMCHTAARAANGLDLQSPGSWARLVNVKASVGKPLVVPSDPNGSYLFEKVVGRPLNGTQMPPGLPLHAVDIERIKWWIAAGAPDD